MPGVKTNEREGTRAVLRHSRMSAYKVRQVLEPDPRPGRHPGRRDPGQRRPRGRHRGRQGPGLGRGQRRPQRRAGRRGAVRVGLLRRRGQHPEALAPAGPWPCHPHPQADLAHHHHREPHARRADRPSPGQAVRRRRPALAPCGRLAPPADRADAVDADHAPTATTDTGPRRGPTTPCRPTTWSPRRRPDPLEESDLETEADGTDEVDRRGHRRRHPATPPTTTATPPKRRASRWARR